MGRWLLIFCLGLFTAGSTAFAQAPGMQKQMISFTAMALTSSTQQGGEGPAGSTILSHSEYIYAWPRFGAGFFFMYDLQGSTEKDNAYGLKLEYYLDPFYVEAGYALKATRAYTDRTIAEQTGTGTLFGLGVRFKLGAGGGPGAGWFFQASYKYRTLDITQQDGAELSESIKQTDGYPLLGLGYQF